MASKDLTRIPEHRAHEQRLEGERHSDVVPKDLSQALAALRTSLAPHLSWPEGLRVPDETRDAWMQAYESGFDRAFVDCERGDWLVPLVYASGDNDERFGRGLLRFAYEVALDLPDTDEAFAMLEVAEATLGGGIGKDVCARIAENLVDEAYARFEHDRRFDRYFFCHCAAAVARVVSSLSQPSSARDAIEAIQSAVAAVRAQQEQHEREAPSSSEATVLRLAAKCLREELAGVNTGRPSHLA